MGLLKKSYELEWEGTPIPLQRPRLSRFRTYDPQSAQKKALVSRLEPILSVYPCLEIPIVMTMEFNFCYPKSYSKKRRVIHPRGGRPDLDNLLKYPLDVFNGILWKDDSLITVITATKRYNSFSSTYIKYSAI